MYTFSDVNHIFEQIKLNNQEVSIMYYSMKERVNKKPQKNLKELFKAMENAIIQGELLPKEYQDKYLDNFMYELALELLYTAQNTLKRDEQEHNEKRITTNSKIKQYLKAKKSTSNYSVLSPKISVNKKQMRDDYEIMNLKLSLKSIRFFSTMGLSQEKKEQEGWDILLEPIDEIYVYDHYSQLVYNPNNKGILIKNLYDLIFDFLNIHTDKRQRSVKQEVAAYIFEKIFFPIQYSKCFASYFAAYKGKISLSMNPIKLLTYVKMYDTCFMSFSDYLRQQYSVLSMEDNSKLLEEAYCMSQLCLKYNLPILQLSIKKIIFEIYDGRLDELKKSLEEYIYNRCLLDSKGEFSYYKKLQVALVTMDEGCYEKGKGFITSKSVKTGSKEYIFNTIMSKMFYGKEDLDGWFHQYRNGNEFYEFVLRHYRGLDDYYQDKCLRDMT